MYDSTGRTVAPGSLVVVRDRFLGDLVCVGELLGRSGDSLVVYDAGSVHAADLEFVTLEVING